MSKLPHRTLKRAIRLEDMSIISSDDLLAMHDDKYQALRREATRANNNNISVFVCEKCGHSVYAPMEPITKKPYWKHHKATPIGCPWWTGSARSVDQVSAGQFNGAQESPLHNKIKHLLAEILNNDPLTKQGSVVIDQYYIAQEGRKKPDIFVEYDNRKIVFEIQLSTTQIPIIVHREDFYFNNNINIIWVTWSFEDVDFSRMRQSFKDIFFSHNKNIFSIDNKIFSESKLTNKFLLNAFWQEQNIWHSKTVNLTELAWPDSGLPYFMNEDRVWIFDFRKRWLDNSEYSPASWQAKNRLMLELLEKLDIDKDSIDLEMYEKLIDLILSFVEKKVIGSKQKNHFEFFNSFFNSPKNYRFARLMEKVIEKTRGSEFFNEKASVSNKLAKAKSEKQDGRASLTGKIVLKLFPEIFESDK